MENKILLGIFYIFTGGLFGIGILVDMINYINQLVHLKNVDGDINGDY
jgi:hypothetical protein